MTRPLGEGGREKKLLSERDGFRMISFFKKLFGGKNYGDPIYVISGLPRSGTSMAMKMLDAGGLGTVVDGERTADEDNPKGYFEDERVKRLHEMTDKTWVKEARGKVIKVISFLLKDLPDTNYYKVVFMRRNLDEVLASQNKMLDNRGEPNETPDDRMKELYKTHVGQVENLLAARENYEVIYMDYTAILDKPLECAIKLNGFLDLDLDTDKMASVVDKNLYRNRRKTAP